MHIILAKTLFRDIPSRMIPNNWSKATPFIHIQSVDVLNCLKKQLQQNSILQNCVQQFCKVLAPCWHRGSWPTANGQTLRLSCLRGREFPILWILCSSLNEPFMICKSQQAFKQAHLALHDHPEQPPSSLCHFQWRCRNPQQFFLFFSQLSVQVLMELAKGSQLTRCRPGSQHSFLDSERCTPQSWTSY